MPCAAYGGSPSLIRFFSLFFGVFQCFHIRNLSDSLCREHNLSVIPDSNRKGNSYKEWMENQNNHSWKHQVRADINDSIKKASTYEKFLKIMASKGYNIEDSGFHNSAPRARNTLSAAGKRLWEILSKTKKHYRLNFST